LSNAKIWIIGSEILKNVRIRTKSLMILSTCIGRALLPIAHSVYCGIYL